MDVMKKIISIISISISLSGSAQELWNMEKCMAYAADHASTVVQARWDAASASVSRNEALADFFPSVSAQVGSQFNWGRNIDPETNTYNNVTTFNNGYGVYASLTLFDGGQTLNRFRQARSERERCRNIVEMRQDDSAIAAMMAFADALYYLNSIGIAEERIRQSEGMLTLTRTQEELGLKGRPDVAQAEATLANDRYNLIHQRNQYEQSMLTLRSSMNLPPDEPLALDTTASVPVGILTQDDPENIFAEAMMINPKIKDARWQVSTGKYGYKIAVGNLLPNISLNARISTSYYKTITGGYEVPGFGEQFRNNRGEYISATLSIPIFQGLRRISAKKRAKYSLEKAKENLEEQERRLHDEIVGAVRDRDGYAAEIIALKAKTDADAEAYRLNTRKYEEGLLSLIDLQLSANTYFASKVELLQKQMLYILKDKLVEYYKGNRLWM